MTNNYEKHYDTDLAKAKARDLLGKMIDETLLKFRRANKIRVLHFGGIDLAEAKQVYLPRGILPENIVSIEREKRIAEEQKKKGIGIRVINATLENYLENQKDIDFEIVSLDYTCPISSNNLLLLHSLRDKQKRNSFIFHCVHLLQRDRTAKNLYLEGLIASQNRLHIDGVQALSSMINSGKIFLDKVENGSHYKDERTNSISNLISNAFTGVDYSVNHCTLRALYGENFDAKISDAEEHLRQIFNDEKFVLDINKKPSNALEYMASLYLGHLAVRDVRGWLNQNGLEKIDNYAIAWILRNSVSKRKPWGIFGEITYSYVSESGSPMMGYVAFLRHSQILLNQIRDVTGYLGFPDKLTLRDKSKFIGKLYEYNRLAERERLHLVSNPSQTFFLGNSSKPVLTKKRFVEELEDGRTIEEIQQNYRGWQNKPLPQWKAHYTMGTYKFREMAEESTEDSDLEKITKEQAIDLLSSEIPPKEIYDAWPTSFSLGQLRAYKSHISMRSYKENTLREQTK